MNALRAPLTALPTQRKKCVYFLLDMADDFIDVGFPPGSGSCGNLSRYGISAFAAGNVDDPIAQQKFLRLGKMPSVTSTPFFSPRTTLTSRGSAKPCVATNSLDAVRSLLMPRRTAMCASISCFD